MKDLGESREGWLWGRGRGLGRTMVVRYWWCDERH